MIDYDVARDKLAQFEHADDIARFLHSEGVIGLQGLSDTCAIARWMQSQTGKPVYVSTTTMWNDYDGVPQGEREHTIAIADFVYRVAL